MNVKDIRIQIKFCILRVDALVQFNVIYTFYLKGHKRLGLYQRKPNLILLKKKNIFLINLYFVF